MYFEVELDFVLKEAWVFLQRLSEPGHAFTDSQQLHRVAVVVPGRSDVLKYGRIKPREKNSSICSSNR